MDTANWTVKAMGKKHKLYDATQWRHLPTDSTMNEFRKSFKDKTLRKNMPSHTWMQSALFALDPENSATSIYNDLFSKRSDTDLDPPEMEGRTYPRLIAWETTELISTILEVRDKHKAIRGEEFAEKVVNQLTKMLLASIEKDRPEGYIDTHYLCSENIRHKLLLIFEEPFKKRLELIYKYIFDAQSGVDVDTLRITLEKLDGIIADFREKSRTELPSYKKELQSIYHKLLSEREQLLPQKARENGKLEYYQWNPKVDISLVNDMRRQIEATSRNPSKEDVFSFLENYQKYLEFLISPAVKEDTHEFWTKYVDLHRYFFSEHDTDEFERNIRADLYLFAQDIFNDLANLDNISYPYSYYTPKHAISAYAKNKLADVHRDIQIKIHQPVRILRTVYSFFYFTLGKIDLSSDGKQKQIHIAKEMLKQIELLIKKHPNIPIIDPRNKESLAPYLLKYEEYAAPIFGNENISETLLYQLFIPESERGSSYYIQRFWSISEALKMNCKLIVACEIHYAIKQLVKEYDDLKKYL